MGGASSCWFLFLAIQVFVHISQCSELLDQVFLSPVIVLEPGLVSDKYYYQVDFPRGHIAVKSFTGEIVDEDGNSIPLHETYLHHWIVFRYYHRKGKGKDKGKGDDDFIFVKNSGMCESGLPQYFGVGAETRGTATDIPDPYGIEVGNPEDIPEGFEEGWMINVHAIDTRGAEDKLGCSECRCDLFNVSVDSQGRALPPTYNGGLACCYDGRRCRVENGFEVGGRRSVYFRYRVKYVEWDTWILPVKIYILDVSDVWDGVRARHNCLIEYEVEACPIGEAKDGCTDTKILNISLPSSGRVIYAVGHQHAGGVGTSLYGDGGRVICSSNPTYGRGTEAGNESGYIVGMSTCYPEQEEWISAGETLTFVSKYSSARRHTGVMGLFYILLASHTTQAQAQAQAATTNIDWILFMGVFGVAMAGGILILILIAVYRGRGADQQGYQTI